MKGRKGAARIVGLNFRSLLFSCLLLFCLPNDAFAQVAWARTYGGALNDEAYSIEQTTDGGYVVAGDAYSFGAGFTDFWVLKLDASGNVQWEKTYGGVSGDFVYSIQQTSDGGFVVAGNYSFGTGFFDFWVLKLDASGAVQWQKTYGGASNAVLRSIQQTTDGGYVVAGRTSFGAGSWDIWALKLDASGNIQWQKTYGGGDDDRASHIEQTTDGGYIMAGWTWSFGAGSADFWVLKLDANGDLGPPGTWQKTYGGGLDDYAESIQQTSDGGYVVAGFTDSFGAGGDDFWVLKLDASGAVQWQKTYGGASDDYAYSIQQTSDGGFVVAGWTWLGLGGGSDFWVLKLDASGNVTWQKTYGGIEQDYGRSIQQTADGGYVVAGGTWSFGAGENDVWVLKLDANGEIDASCTFIADTAVTGADTTVTPADTAVAGADSLTTPADIAVTGADSTATVNEQCPCPILSCNSITVDADPVCDGTAQNFTANTTGGVAPLTVDWDFSYDGKAFNVEATGNPITYTQPAAGGYTVAARVTDSCINPPPQACIATIPVTIENLPDIVYDAAFDPAATLAEACGDGDAVVEPGEEWQATVQLINNAAACSANNVKADLTVNPGSAVAAAMCNNPGVYGSIPPGGTAQFTYSFVVDSLAVCVNDITFDVTGIVSDEGAYPDEVAAFGVTVGQVTVTAAQATDPLAAKNGTVSSDFAPAFTLAAPAASAMLSYTLTHDGGVDDMTECTKVELIDPLAGLTLIKNFLQLDPAKPVPVTAAYIKGGTYQLQLTEDGKGCGSGYATISSGTLSVTSSIGCDASACACPTTCAADILPDAPAICAGGSVTLDANPTAGTPPFTFLWSPGGETTQTINVSPAVTTVYSVTVTDSLSCVVTPDPTETVTVNANPTATILVSGCIGLNMELDANPAGGTPPYTYVWNPGGATTQTIVVVGDGVTTYDVTVTDANTCQGTDNYTVLLCLIDCIASATATALGPTTFCAGGSVDLVAAPDDGTGPFSYVWSPGGETTQMITVTTANTYSCDVTDNEPICGNTVATNSIVVTVNANPSVLITESACDVPTPGDVTLTANPSGGTPPYSYLWNPGGETTQTIVVVGDGVSSYDVTVTDSAVPPCSVFDILTVQTCTEPLPEEVTGLKALNVDGSLWEVEEILAATMYHVYANPLATLGAVAGDEYDSPDAPAAGTCSVGTGPGAPGAINLIYTLPDNYWFVVTAASEAPGSETTPGYDSSAIDRSTVGLWLMCGP